MEGELRMSSFETASADLHGIDSDKPASVAGSEVEEPFLSVFGATKSIQFEQDDSSEWSFFICDSDGKCQAEGDKNHFGELVVKRANGMEMLKVVHRPFALVWEQGCQFHTFTVNQENDVIGTIKVAIESSSLATLQLFRADGLSIPVKSLKIGEYAVFRDDESLDFPLCNIQMTGADGSKLGEFNMKIVFHPETGITEEEQLICTAGAIAFKARMRYFIRSKVKQVGQGGQTKTEDVRTYKNAWIIGAIVICICLGLVLYLHQHKQK